MRYFKNNEGCIYECTSDLKEYKFLRINGGKEPHGHDCDFTPASKNQYVDGDTWDCLFLETDGFVEMSKEELFLEML